MRGARLVVAVLLVLTSGEVARAQIASTFDAGLEGWTTDNTGALTHQASGGNPGGFLQLDNDEGGIAHLFAPASFLGDRSAFNGLLLTFSGNLVAGGGGTYQSPDDYGVVRISGGGMTASVDVSPNGAAPPLAAWQTYSVALDAATWGKSSTDWATILANVTEIRVTVEALFGSEVQGLDTFRLGVVGSTTTTTTTSTSSTTSTTTSTVPTTSSTSTSTPTSSTSITSVPSTTTTTTTLPAMCDGIAPAPSFASIRCRLVALRTATAAATALGDLRPKLDQPLDKAIDRTDLGQDLCASSDAKKARNRLKQVRRQLIQYSHRLRGLKARKTAPESVREPLASEGDAISADAKTFRAALACPADAT
jgi:hypothetical protein